MRVFFFSFIVCTMYLTAFSQEGGEASQVKFDKTSHDFGSFTERSEIQKCKFEIENTGKNALVILNIKTSCGCAVASYTYAPLKPGHKGTINVHYDGKNKASGIFIKSIMVYTNVRKKPFVLYIKGKMN